MCNTWRGVGVRVFPTGEGEERGEGLKLWKVRKEDPILVVRPLQP